MKRLLVISIMALVLSSAVWAQTSPVKRSARTLQIAVDEDAIPVIKDVAVYVNFDRAQNASTEIRSADSSGKLSAGQLRTLLRTLTSQPTAKTPTPKGARLDPVYVFKPDLSQTLGDIVDTINTVRNSKTNSITIDLNDGAIIYVRRKASANRSVKPNPLFLMIEVDAKNKITLNGDQKGTITDLTKLKDQLAEIFRERAENGVVRIGSNTVDSTVDLVVPTAMNFGDVQKLVSALGSVGADRIFLVLDRQDVLGKGLIMSIEGTPVIR